MIYKFPFFFLTLLFISTIGFSTPAIAGSEVFINDYLTTVKRDVIFNIPPSRVEKHFLLSKNDLEIDTTLELTFDESKNYYGFIVLICDEKNTKRYLDRKKSMCHRYIINDKDEKAVFKAKSHTTYYLLILNKTQPLDVGRQVIVSIDIKAHLSQQAKQIIDTFLKYVMSTMVNRYNIEPYNFAVVPCNEKYIPSSYQTRTLTICSEMILNEDSAPNKTLMLAETLSEISPFLMDDWNEKAFDGERSRFTFAMSLMLTFINNPEPLEEFVTYAAKNPHIFNIMQMRYIDNGFSHEKRVGVLQEFSATPRKVAYDWLNLIYTHMDKNDLESIKNGKLVHYGATRNLALLVLRRREDQN